MGGKYINPYTDFGFKKLFGEEANKDLLIDFLNEVLPKENKIRDLTFKPTEKSGHNNEARIAIFDINCEGPSGEQFIVELQKARIEYFKDRMLYYSSFPIQEQAKKGEWNYQLKPVFCIAILDFEFNDYLTRDYINFIKLINQHNEIFYDKLTFIILQMPRFNKKESELENHFDKWLYFFKNLNDFNDIPSILKEPIFNKAFREAEIAKMDKKDYENYKDSLKEYTDFQCVMDNSFSEGIKKGKIEGKLEGIKEGKIEDAKKMKNKGFNIQDISEITGLSIDEISKV